MKLIILTAFAAALVTSVSANTADTYLRSYCGKWTGGMPAATEAKNIVQRMWQRKQGSCSYANNGFRRDATRAINKEFPDNCRQQNAVSFL